MLVLGAGLAGMTAALELRAAGYKVQVLEFNSRPGGRNWTIRGGDRFTELGGATQTCGFEEGLYLNPGPWRIPYHHRALLDYCKRLGVALEPFIQLNHNALLHASNAFAGKPQRIRDIKADFQGHVSELLAKVTQQSKLDEAVSVEDREILLQALRSWGALDKNYAYKANLISADYRGYAKDPGGGLGAAPVAGEPINLSDILKSRLWRYLQNFALHQFQTTMFQPVGGMDMIGKAFAKQIGDLIQYDAKVIRIQQNDGGVTVSYVNSKTPSTPQIATAEWCVCTIPLSILGIQIDQHRTRPATSQMSGRGSIATVGSKPAGGIRFLASRRPRPRSRRWRAKRPFAGTNCMRKRLTADAAAVAARADLTPSASIGCGTRFDHPHTETNMRYGLLASAALLLGSSVAQADIVRYPIPNSTFPIAQAVRVSGDAATYYVSGQVPPVISKDADPSSPQAYGDTKTQTVGVLNKIKQILEGQGLGMADVVKMQVFLVHDARAPMDFKAFMEGYTQFFGGTQPNLPARSVVGIAALANPGFLVEIEVVAAKDSK